MVTCYPNQASAPERSCHFPVHWQGKFSEEVEATTFRGFSLKHLGFFRVHKQRYSSLSFLLSLSQLRRVPTLFPGQSLVPQRKHSTNQTANTKLFQLSTRKWSATKLISAKLFFCSEKGPYRTSTVPSSQQHNRSVFPYCKPSWGKAEVPVWGVY